MNNDDNDVISVRKTDRNYIIIFTIIQALKEYYETESPNSSLEHFITESKIE